MNTVNFLKKMVCRNHRQAGASFMLALCMFALSFTMAARSKHAKECKAAIYKTADDLKNNHPAQGSKIATGIHLTKEGIEEVLKLKFGDTTVKYFEGNVYAYTDEDCKLHRYCKEYGYIDVLNRDGICLYSRRTKGKYHHTHYYFSKDLYSPMVALTQKNLLREYADQPSFAALVKEIKNEEKLTRIDKHSGRYYIAVLYESAK